METSTFSPLCCSVYLRQTEGGVAWAAFIEMKTTWRAKKKNTHAGFKLFSFLISSVENTLLYVEHLGQTHSAGPCSSADYVCVLSH